MGILLEFWSCKTVRQNSGTFSVGLLIACTQRSYPMSSSSSETHSTGQNPGGISNWIQELSKQHWKEAGSACHGKPFLWQEDGSGEKQASVPLQRSSEPEQARGYRSRLGNFKLCLCCSKVTVRACFLVLWSSVPSCLHWLVQASVSRSLICPCISGVWESIANLIRKMWNLFAEFLEELRLQANLFRRKMLSYCVVGEKIRMFWTCCFLSELLHAWDKIQSSVLFLVKWPLWGNRMKILKWLGKIIFKYRGDAEKEAQTNVTSKTR